MGAVMKDYSIVCVVARNYYGFRDFIHEKMRTHNPLSHFEDYGSTLISGDTKYIYVDTVATLYECHNVKITFLPGCNLRDDFDEIKERAKFAEMA